MNSVLNYILYFFFYSFAGWIMETIYCSIGNKRFVNRGFLRGPLCPIYGTGATVLGVCLMPFFNRWGYSKWYIIVLVIILGMILADIVEFLTSVIMEKLFNARWWDYSNNKFNIQGRICLKHTLYWGIATGMFIYVIHPNVVNLFSDMLTNHQRNQIIVMVLLVFAIDLFFAVKGAIDVRKFVTKLSKFSDSVSETASTVRQGMEQTYENIHDSFEKNGFRFAVWATDVTRQISEFKSNFDKPDKETLKKTKNRITKQNAARLYKAGNIQKAVKTKINSLENMVSELKTTFFDEEDKEDK